MSDTTSGVFENPPAASPMPPTSRYFGVELARLETDQGAVVYLRRRFVPSADRFELLVEVTVMQDDRLDNLTAKYLGDPEQFWRVCDANNALRPDELTQTAGRRLRITFPEGVPGPRNA